MSDYMTTEGCHEKHNETMALLTEINNRLYKDNGQKSIQSKLNEQEIIIGKITDNQKKMDAALTRLFWTVMPPLITGCLWIGFIAVKHLITIGKL